MIVSVMVATYNRLNLTKETFSDLDNSIDIDYNFIIIDNGSTDGTIEYLKDYSRDNVKVVYNEKNLGIATARNQGLKIANELGSDYFCYIDNDVKMPVGWLSECISILEDNKKYAMIGVNMEGNRYPTVTLNGHTFQDKPAGNLGTACMVFPKRTHSILGYFNNVDYSPFYGLEDADYGMRARVLGLKLGYIDRMGEHLGVGDQDVGEYRAFKTKEHDSYLSLFKSNYALYRSGKKPIYFKYA